MKSKLEILLEQKAKEYEREAKHASTQFNKGYFEGKEEQALLTIAALRKSLTGTPQDMLDALNGDA